MQVIGAGGGDWGGHWQRSIHWPGDSHSVRDDASGYGFLLVVLFCVIDRYQKKSIKQKVEHGPRERFTFEECLQTSGKIYIAFGGNSKEIEIRGKQIK